jgi:hypothetical protein
MLIDDPIENSDANDPTLPIDAHDPTDPMDSTEPSDHNESTEFVEPTDHRAAMRRVWRQPEPAYP